MATCHNSGASAQHARVTGTPIPGTSYQLPGTRTAAAFAATSCLEVMICCRVWCRVGASPLCWRWLYGRRLPGILFDRVAAFRATKRERLSASRLAARVTAARGRRRRRSMSSPVVRSVVAACVSNSACWFQECLTFIPQALCELPNHRKGDPKG